MYQLITTTDELQTVCTRLNNEPYITVDTEFLREKTYYPKLCLVQISGTSDDIIIDPLAEGIDLSPLYSLLANENVLKVFHAAQQDAEIFHRLMRHVPTPLFDTQVAAMVCGFGESVGYESLVNKLLEKQLDKVSRYTDWEQRPLTERQLQYAIADVTHLRDIYEALKAHIHNHGREEWIAEEMAKMNASSQYTIDPEESWRRLKYKNRSPAYLNLLRSITSWRERTAQIKNIPRGRLLKDEVLIQIASLNPKTMDELTQVRGAMRHLNADNAQALLDALATAREIPREDHPIDEKRKPMLQPEQDGLVDVLRMLLKLKSDQNGVAARLVANKDDLASLVLNTGNVPCMHGWRYEIFGQHAQAFLDGKLLLRAHNGEITFEEVA